MANSNAPYGFRLWSRLTGGSGAAPLSPGQLKFPSAASLKVGDPVKVSLGLGYLAAGTNAIFGICMQPVPGWNETATAVHYPDVEPADDQSVFRVQSIGATVASIGYLRSDYKYRIGGTTSGYTGIDLSKHTGGVLTVIGLAPGSAWGTYAELLVTVSRGNFAGQV
jgi:hypothetical protein